MTSRVSFGIQGRGTLVARVFEDLDGNGVWDAGEPPLGGVPVDWLNEFGESDFDVTDATGIIWSGARRPRAATPSRP